MAFSDTASAGGGEGYHLITDRRRWKSFGLTDTSKEGGSVLLYMWVGILALHVVSTDIIVWVVIQVLTTYLASSDAIQAGEGGAPVRWKSGSTDTVGKEGSGWDRRLMAAQ